MLTGSPSFLGPTTTNAVIVRATSRWFPALTHDVDLSAHRATVSELILSYKSNIMCHKMTLGFSKDFS